MKTINSIGIHMKDIAKLEHILYGTEQCARLRTLNLI